MFSLFIIQALWLCCGNKKCIFSKNKAAHSSFTVLLETLGHKYTAFINIIKLPVHDPETGEINKKDIKNFK